MASVFMHREVVRALMDRYRFRSSDIATLASIPASTVRNVVNGYRDSVELDTAKAIAKALGVSVNAIASVDAPPRRRAS